MRPWLRPASCSSAQDERRKTHIGGAGRRSAFRKAFNATFAAPLTAGEVAGHKLGVLIAGNDEDAKGKVAALARDGGLNPIDVGPLKRARELEAAGLLHTGVSERARNRLRKRP